MVLNKYSQLSDGIADLYRASFYFAKGTEKTGMNFLLKAKNKLGSKMLLDTRQVIGNSYWAEKVLDEYKRLKRSLSS